MLSTFTYPPIKATLKHIEDNDFVLSVSPLLPGFGYTFGNSLRRIMLSSVPGFAVTKVRINDLTHEYQTIDHVKEDALDVLLNLKSLRAQIITDEEKVTIVLKTNKDGEITAKDFEKNAAVKIVNKDLYICTLSKGGKLHIELEISRGHGYLPYEKRDLRGNTDPTGLLIDAVFSPVRNVALDVDQVRVGDQTNFDNLLLSFSTDGTVVGQEVADFTLKLFNEMLGNIYSSFGAGVDGEKAVKESTKASKETTVSKAASKSKVEAIELPARILKILEKNGINTNQELIEKEDEISEYSGLGEKALESIQEYIEKIK